MYDVTPITSPKERDCGATCLQMLLKYYGIDADLETLVKQCKTRAIGCTAKDIMTAAKQNGLEMIAYKMDCAELIQQDRPAIIWWKYHHFVIFCGMNEQGKPVICNPDRGRYGLTVGTFKSFYSCVALFNGEPHDLSETVTAE